MRILRRAAVPVRPAPDRADGQALPRHAGSEPRPLLRSHIDSYSASRTGPAVARAARGTVAGSRTVAPRPVAGAPAGSRLLSANAGGSGDPPGRGRLRRRVLRTVSKERQRLDCPARNLQLLKCLRPAHDHEGSHHADSRSSDRLRARLTPSQEGQLTLPRKVCVTACHDIL
jgi:hypothetical protein